MEKPKDSAPADYYVVLGVSKDASMQQITTSYRKLALKWHPDRNRGPNQEEATERFKAASEAYATLSDTTKRRRYDLHGHPPDPDGGGGGGGGGGGLQHMEAVEVENVGFFGRFLAAQMAKLGVPIPTSVSPDVLGTAKAHAAALRSRHKAGESEAAVAAVAAAAGGGGGGGGGDLPKLPAALVAGRMAEGRVGLSSAAFFTFEVDGACAASGVVLAAKARRKTDRFRLLVFDDRGDVRFQAESSVPPEDKGGGGGRAVARCRLFLCPFPTVSVGPPFPSLDGASGPPVCHALDTLEERPPAFGGGDDGGGDREGGGGGEEGEGGAGGGGDGGSGLGVGVHLCAVYCDNFLSAIDFTVAAVPLECGDGAAHRSRVDAMAEVASALRAKRRDLGDLAETFVAKREALQRAQDEFKAVAAACAAEEAPVAELLSRHAALQADAVSAGLAHRTAGTAGTRGGAPPPPPPPLGARAGTEAAGQGQGQGQGNPFVGLRAGGGPRAADGAGGAAGMDYGPSERRGLGGFFRRLGVGGGDGGVARAQPDRPVSSSVVL